MHLTCIPGFGPGGISTFMRSSLRHATGWRIFVLCIGCKHLMENSANRAPTTRLISLTVGLLKGSADISKHHGYSPQMETCPHSYARVSH